MDSGVGNVCCKVIENSVTFPTENLSFALDAAFDQDSKQDKIYEIAGKGTIEDILNGYNGTIFAYGQTGSGKTYTMFGPDIYDEELKGIIPRAAMDIFKVWEAAQDLKEVEIRCSMLEIYKENLRDLLTDDYSELKIKESPNRGIYVEGLCEIPIVCVEELMYYLDLGGTRRAWAETRHNLVSSRSHTIFILEVRQIFNNECEKRGILNLVDLAGSEKVGKTGAQGQLFAEGTKINLSLSVLGNVIHALSTNMEYVPYRDSKLTRLLQESLGGNYKTTLIVTCSPHLSQIQESISTLKFAQRAKKLKNHVQMNIKSSPDQLQKIIDQLKKELRQKDTQLARMRSMSISCSSPRSSIPSSNKAKNTKITKQPPPKINVNVEGNSKNQVVFKNNFSEYTRNSAMCRSQSLGSLVKINGIKCEKDEYPEEIIVPQAESELLQKVKTLTIQLDIIKKEKSELEQKLCNLEITCSEERKKSISLEIQLAELDQFIKSHNLNESRIKVAEQCENTENRVLKSQIKALTDALEDSETECFKLLKEKKEKLEKETLEMCNLSLTDFVSKDMLHTSFTDKWINDMDSVDLGLAGSFIGPKKLFSNKSELKLEAKKLLSACKYAETIGTAVVDEYVSPETLNYLLRNQLIDASVINHNLKRVVSLLVWKLQVERSNANIKDDMCKALQKTVDSLEDLLRKSSEMHQAWKKRVEKLDYQIEQLKNHTDIRKSTVLNTLIKTRIRKPVTKHSMLHMSTFKLPSRIGPKSKGSTQNVIVRKSSDEKLKVSQCTEDNGEPQVAEMNEEDEIKLQEDINARYNAMLAEQKSLGKRNITNNLLHPDVIKTASQNKVQSSICLSFKNNQIEELTSNLQEIQIELAWHKTLTDLLMTEVVKTREQASILKKQVEEIKSSSEQAIQDENRNWQLITNSLKVFFCMNNNNKKGKL